MSVLENLGLSADKVREMTGATKPEKALKESKKASPRTVPRWVCDWLKSRERSKTFTLRDVSEETKKIIPTVQTGIRLAISNGLVEVVKSGTPGTGIRQFTRTENGTEPNPRDSHTMARIRALKPGTVVDYLRIKAVSQQAAIHMLRRGAQAGLLKPAEWRVRSGTVYRKVTK